MTEDLVDRCKIWEAGDETIGELGKSMPGFANIVAQLLKLEVPPEKVTLETVQSVYIDHYGAKIPIDKCVEKYNLR
jgi:hypothetical protein